ncbi:MAG TPA: hypothetical protein VHH36_06900, partial [Candidatus Thermoplasmatota archaeon]|nr:hypothetical protein [Candidatus Thermoplasmatota archaeon]
MRLTRAGAALATAGLALLGLGMATANLELLVLSVLPLALVGHALAARSRRAPSGSRTVSTRTPRRGDPLDVEARVALPGASDLVEVHVPLPGPFALEQGTNLHLFAGKGERALRFRARSEGRGRHVLPPVTAETLDPSGLLAARASVLAPEETIEVTPRTYAGRVVRGRAEAALQIERLRARTGVGSSDFRELRDYAWGDP